MAASAVGRDQSPPHDGTNGPEPGRDGWSQWGNQRSEARAMASIVFGDRGSSPLVGERSRDLARAALAALVAPSILNSQPWRWRIDADLAQLRADHGRQLTTLDPQGRLLTLSCGVALHHAVVALSAAGVA